MEESQRPWGESSFLNLLAARHSGSAWAFLPQVRNCTGYGHSVRTADALAMSVWPSRGLHLHGFEIKVSRSDWTRELANPEKAEEICKFCDFWWIVAPPGIVREGELPKTWGLMEPKGKGLAVKVDAPKLDAVPIDRNFLASLLRNAAEHVVPKAQIDDRLQAEYQRGLERGKESCDWEIKHAKDTLTNLQGVVRDFESKSGIRLGEYSDGKALGEAVEIVRRQHGLERAIAEATGEIRQAEQSLEGWRRKLEVLEAAKGRLSQEAEDKPASAGGV